MKSVLEDYTYLPHNIYNMDECGFQLQNDRRARRIAPRTSSSKSQSSLAVTEHFTVVAAISTSDSPVPPFLIYQGKYLLEEWVKVRDSEPKMDAAVSESGYINGYLIKQWLRDCFDPSTRDRAEGLRRLLFLDGHLSHTNVDFLEACWDRNIVCVVLPAHLSGVFQPLDVNFFNTLKHHYSSQIDKYQLGSSSLRASKAFFYRWLQRAWARTANSRQIRSAWRQAGLHPLSRTAMDCPITPPKEIPSAALSIIPETPHTPRHLRTLVSASNRGEIPSEIAISKLQKGFERALADAVLMEQDLRKREAAEALDRAARTSTRTRYPQGQLFDQKYQEEHAIELAAAKESERQTRLKRKGKSKATEQVEPQELVQTCPTGPSTSL